jgi:hypothetical protein
MEVLLSARSRNSVSNNVGREKRARRIGKDSSL